MKAVTISKTGGPEVLELKEINLGKPGPPMGFKEKKI